MKFSILTLIALAIAPSILAVPSPEPVADVVAAPESTTWHAPRTGTLEKRAVSATVVVDGLRYRTCPRTSCTAVGQYAKGTTVYVTCFTRIDTTVVNGDAGWAKLTNGYWVAMAYGAYLEWHDTLHTC